MAGCGAIALLCVLTACSSGGDAAPAPAEPAAATSGHASHTPSASASPGASAAPAAAPASLGEAALRLESLVGQHSLLVADMMRARVRADADLAQAADAALGKNTQAMGTLLGPVIGAENTKAFADLWAVHIAHFSEYARGIADEDAAVSAGAKRALVGHETKLAEFFSAGSMGRLPEKDAKAAVKEHVDKLLDGADAYAAKDYAKSADLYRASYAQAYTLGEALARTILPQKVNAELDTPSMRLRAALTRLLGEHVNLVVAAMRSAGTDNPDFASLGDATNANTLDLTGAIDALYGTEAARGFQKEWSDHIDGLIAYTRAVAADDDAAREKARSGLRGFEQTFATFLDGATESRLGQPALAEVFTMHDRMLLAQIDAYAAKDFTQAHDLGYQTYDEMFTVAGQLSTAIGSTVAAKLPTGGSQTGGGGTAHERTAAGRR